MKYFNVLLDEFEHESDRAAVILAAAIADELLRSILIARFLPVSSSSDDLFDGANAPLGTFSSRIEMAYRTGLISVKFARDLHLIRKIRNDFAHNIHGCSFEDVRVRSRITELDNSHGIYSRSKKEFAEKETGSRQHFLRACSWMIFHLSKLSEATTAVSPPEEEWGYSMSLENEDALLTATRPES